MKSTKKFLAAVTLSAIAVFTSFAMGACNDDPPPQTDGNDLDALTEALQNDIFAENVTVTTTDTRTDKFGYSVPKLRKLWTDGNEGKSFSDNTEHPMFPSKKYTVSNKEGDRIYMNLCTDRTDLQGTEYRLNAWKDESNLTMYGDYSKDKYTAAQWIGRVAGYWSDDWINTCSLAAGEGEEHYNFQSSFYNVFKRDGYTYSYNESTSTYSFPDLYFVMTENMDVLGYYACSITIKLDAQNRFLRAACSFPGNGAITSIYEYGSTTVEIPQDILDAMNAL